MSREGKNRFWLLSVVLSGLLFASATALMGRSVRPTVKIVSPAEEEIVPGPDVLVHVEVSGLELSPGGMSLHFMLDNEPFGIQYDASRPYRFHDVAPGTHTIRVYAATPLHEIIPQTLDVVTFSVAYQTDENRIEKGEPLLTYVLPQGEYFGIDCADITLNFAVSGVQLSRKGYRVQYYVDGRRYIATREGSYHLKGLSAGLHRIRVELVDERGRVVPGPFNAVERVIKLSPEKTPKPYRPGEATTLQSIPGAMTNGRLWVAVPEEKASKAANARPEEQRAAEPRETPKFEILHKRTGYERRESATVVEANTDNAKKEKVAPREDTTRVEEANEAPELSVAPQEEHQRPPEDYPPEGSVVKKGASPTPEVRSSVTPTSPVTTKPQEQLSSAKLAKTLALRAAQESRTTATLKASAVTSTRTEVRRVAPSQESTSPSIAREPIPLPEAELETPASTRMTSTPTMPVQEKNQSPKVKKKASPPSSPIAPEKQQENRGNPLDQSSAPTKPQKPVASAVQILSSDQHPASAQDEEGDTSTIARVLRVPGPVKVERYK